MESVFDKTVQDLFLLIEKLWQIWWALVLVWRLPFLQLSFDFQELFERIQTVPD